MIDESPIDVYRWSKHLKMNEARELDEKGSLWRGDSAGSNSALVAGSDCIEVGVVLA